MTFYNNKLDRGILYESPHGWYYKVGVYQEEYPSGQTETVTGGVQDLDEEEATEYINSEHADEIPKEQVPDPVLKTLRRKLHEADAP